MKNYLSLSIQILLLLSFVFILVGCSSYQIRDTSGEEHDITVMDPLVFNLESDGGGISTLSPLANLLSMSNPLLGGLASATIGAIGIYTTKKSNRLRKKSDLNLSKLQKGAAVASEVIDTYIKGTEAWEEAKLDFKSAEADGAINVNKANEIV